MWKTPKTFIIGIDEVGRGSLAGPVVVAAVILASYRRFKNLKDSKKLSSKQREKWFQYIKSDDVNILYTLARVSPAVIDRINISQAANLAATRAVRRLIADCNIAHYRILLDGSLYINDNYPAKTVIKGDEKYNAIKFASIVAKVTRDRYMKKLHQKYPQYRFDHHKGYGTREHLKVIRRYGPSDVHRLTFIKKYIKLK